MSEDKNNGNITLTDQDVEDLFAGAHTKLEDLRKDDGILANAALKANQASSLLGKFSTPVDNKGFRALLLTGVDPRRANKFIKAKAQCERLYCDKGLDIIIDQLHADAGSSLGTRLMALLNTLTHTSYTVTSRGNNNQRGRWFNRNDRSGASSFGNDE